MFRPHLQLGLEGGVGRCCGSTKLFWEPLPTCLPSLGTYLPKEMTKSGLERCPKAAIQPAALKSSGQPATGVWEWAMLPVGSLSLRAGGF